MGTKSKKAVFKNPDELYECEKGTEVILVFDSGEEYTGIFNGLDDDEIILKSTQSEDTIGLPYNRLKFFLKRIA